MNVNLIGLCATSEPFSLNVDWFQKMNIMQDRTFHVFWEVFFSEKRHTHVKMVLWWKTLKYPTNVKYQTHVTPGILNH